MTTSVAYLGQVPEWTFGDRLRKIRRESGLTQGQFAARIGYTAERYSHWEADRNKPDDIVEVARRIYKEFNVPPSWTLDTGVTPGDDGERSPFPGIPVTRQYEGLPNSDQVNRICRLTVDSLRAPLQLAA